MLLVDFYHADNLYFFTRTNEFKRELPNSFDYSLLLFTTIKMQDQIFVKLFSNFDLFLSHYVVNLV